MDYHGALDVCLKWEFYEKVSDWKKKVVFFTHDKYLNLWKVQMCRGVFVIFLFKSHENSTVFLLKYIYSRFMWIPEKNVLSIIMISTEFFCHVPVTLTVKSSSYVKRAQHILLW